MDTREVVDEFIEETYLETLDETALVKAMERFSEICGKVIAEDIGDGTRIVELNRRLRDIRSRQLQKPPEVARLEERRARRIIENKREILMAIEDVMPGASARIRAQIGDLPGGRMATQDPAPPSTAELRQVPADAVYLSATQLYGAMVLMGAFFALALVFIR